MNQAGARNDSKSRRSPVPKQKRCLVCKKKYSGVGKSIYCSKSCNEKAHRLRIEALIAAFADLLHSRSCELTQQVYGVAFQITYDQALRKASQCIHTNYKPFKSKLEQLGYVYNEALAVWQLQARLPTPLG
jgi:hypothetical protein